MSRILFVASEAVPLAKTGGLGDVCGSLPSYLERLGQEVSLVMPGFSSALQSGLPIERTGHVLEIPVGNRIVYGEVLRTTLPNSRVTVYLIDQPEYFGRKQLYGDASGDFRDNCERFVFFARATLELIRILELDIDILHCHDWQAGLVPVYLQVEYRVLRRFENIRTVFTIHNMAFQGRFWHWDMLLTGLDWKYFNWKQLEFFGELNFLKGGIVFSDQVTTVSPRYAQEIQIQPHGCGLEGILFQRRESVVGILNGADYDVWDPRDDQYLPTQYDVHTWVEGKKICKAELQRQLGLPLRPDVPMLGFIGRLTEQKGIELILGVMRDWAKTKDAQWVLLGTGSPAWERELSELARMFPERVAAVLEFSDRMAHRIEAAADIFLMPSRFEPCGLNQLFSLRYGTVPVVHRTGGLADTVVDCQSRTLANETANGFAFDRFQASDFECTLERACTTYRNDPDVWKQLVETGMRQDWSWNRSAEEYTRLYDEVLLRTKQIVCA
jgi:starch synthase